MDILSSILAQDSYKSSAIDKVIWFLKLMKWMQRPRLNEEKDLKIETVYTVRIKYILYILDKNPDWKNNFIHTVKLMLLQVSSPTTFLGQGFTTSGFSQDLSKRLLEKVLPPNPITEDLEALIYKIFDDDSESLYIDAIDEKVLEELISLFSLEKELHQKLQFDILNATVILSTQILNTTYFIMHELGHFEKQQSGLYELDLLEILQQNFKAKNTDIHSDLLVLLNKSELSHQSLYQQMKTEGVKIGLVYAFQLQKRRLSRLKILLLFLNQKQSQALNLRLFISYLVIETHFQNSLRQFLKENLSLLSNRIVETNSSVGEHYVTYNWQESKKMFVSAVGGGAITAFTVFAKYILAKLPFEGLIKGVVESLNYSISFMAIYILGFTLATKQPSATAPFMAQELKKSTDVAKRSMVALLRTQFIAVIGNLSLVFPLCFFVSWGLLSYNLSFIDQTKSQSIIDSSIWYGPTPLFAIVTALLLVASSLIAGWFENWTLIHHLPDRIGQSEKMIRFFGLARTEKFSNFILHHSNAIAANISLGLLLGIVPQVLLFIGLPIEVRHVTLATGSFALALPVYLSTDTFSAWTLAHSAFGLFVIGIINIGVSFIIAFFLASLSSEIKFKSLLKLFK